MPRYCSSFVNLAGMPIDRKFAGRYYELSQIFDHVDYFSGVLLGLILGLAFLIAACGIEAGSERLRRILDSLLVLSARASAREAAAGAGAITATGVPANPKGG